MMNKILSFIAGSMCGAVVGATIALLLAPSSGEELRGEMVNRWEEALNEARLAMEETRRDLQAQFEMMQQGSYQEEAE
ncbi:MAG: YtxH domain-containing protein [Chloroflexota bacterium]|jgi:gas vesicle protein